MKKLGNNIERLIVELGGDSDQARINMRAHQVRSRFRQALESVYPNTAQLFLQHTNNVYIMKKDDVPTLIVYVDESIYAAELNAQRELIKLKLLELFGEEIEEFKIYVSRGAYKHHHPYHDEEAERMQVQIPPLPQLSAEEKSNVATVVSGIEDEKVRKALEKAMSANLARNISKNGNVS